MAIHTRNIAADILEMFDDVLTAHGIRVPSEEDNERGADNDAALYGMVYWNLLDDVERIVADAANRGKTEDIITGVFE
jgi:hypothetical protein